MPTAIGDLIGQRWRIEAIVGRGGHSVIYRARDLRGGADVAVKVLNDSVAADPEYSVRMQREQRAMAMLAGTAAVKVHALTATADGAPCLVMELLCGKDLDDRLAELEEDGSRMSPEEVVAVIVPIVDTLEAAHAAEIVHRDLKPGNIFVLDRSAGGGVRLLDFGLAKFKRSEPLTREGFVIGSPSYIAPEMWQGARDRIDQRVDVYSLGAIVFRALAGRVPFEAPTLRGKLELATRAPRPSLRALRPELGAAIDDWVERALAIDPAARFQGARALLSALSSALGLTPRACDLTS